jgi:hypothetical protein
MMVSLYKARDDVLCPKVCRRPRVVLPRTPNARRALRCTSCTSRSTYTIQGQRGNEETYQTLIQDFFSDAPYVAKCLWRDELLPAKWCLDYDMKYICIWLYPPFLPLISPCK